MDLFFHWNNAFNDLCRHIYVVFVGPSGPSVWKPFRTHYLPVGVDVHISWIWRMDIYYWTLLGQSTYVYKKLCNNKNIAWNGDAILPLAPTGTGCTGIRNSVGVVSWLLPSYNYFINDMFIDRFISRCKIAWSCPIFFWVALEAQYHSGRKTFRVLTPYWIMHVNGHWIWSCKFNSTFSLKILISFWIDLHILLTQSNNMKNYIIRYNFCRLFFDVIAMYGWCSQALYS